MIDASGLYPYFPEEAYHADPVIEPSLSCSIAQLLITRSPAHAAVAHPRLSRFYEEKHSDRFDLGKAAHAMLLGDETQFAIVEAENWTTKDAKAAKAQARAEGKVPMLAEQWKRTRLMVEVVREQMEEMPELQGVLEHAEHKELTVVWREGDSWCRCRPDLVTGNRIIDFKITGTAATPDAWASKTAWQMLYDFRAAYYLRGINWLLPDASWRYQFVVIEDEPPYALSLFEPPPQAYEEVEPALQSAIDLWALCRRTNRWPGYPQTLQWMESPKWAGFRWEVLAHQASHSTRREIEAAAGYVPPPHIDHPNLHRFEV